MGADKGSQILSVNFHDPVNSYIINKRFEDVRPLGIYSGGRLSGTGGTTVIVSPLVCEISDGTYQVKIETQASYSVTGVSEGEPYIVLSWVYTEDPDDNYMDIKHISAPDVNDLTVGKAVFSDGVISD